MSAPLPAPASPDDGPDAVHPNWCSALRCRRVGSDVRHLSEPVTWPAQADDAEYSLALHRLDGLDGPGERGYLITVRHHGVEAEASTWGTDADLDGFAVARMKLRAAEAGGEITDVSDAVIARG